MSRLALIGWEPLGSRIITGSFSTTEKMIVMSSIQFSALTNGSDDQIKQDFYSHLQSVIRSCIETDITILMGALNANVGNANSGYGGTKD